MDGLKGKDVHPGWMSTPTLADDDSTIREYLHNSINHLSRFRRWHMLRKALNIWFYRGRHWIEPLGRFAPDGNGAYYFRELYRNSSAIFPRPVTNLIAPAVDNEVARLGKREYVPSVIAYRNIPEQEKAAKLAKDVLLYDLQQMAWADKREALAFDLMVTGTCVARSRWDETITDTMVIGNPDAAVCTGCGLLLSSPEISKNTSSQFQFHDGALQQASQGSDDNSVQFSSCPACNSPLSSYAVSEDEAQGGEDGLGRSLGLTVPRGKGDIEVVSPFDIYPENGGVNVEPPTCKIWSQASVRDLDWIAERIPDAATDLHPEDARELQRYHPTMGDQAFQAGGFSAVGDRDIYSHHARVYESYIDPRPGLPDGAIFAMVNEKIWVREPLVVSIDTPNGPKRIKKVTYAGARFKRIPGEFWGRSPIDDGISPQRRMNELDAQVQDIRERGIPQVWTPIGTQINAHDDTGGTFRQIEVESVRGDWKPSDGIFPAQPITGREYYEERDRIMADMQKILGPQPVEQGEAPKNIKTTSGLMILNEEAAQKRAPMERAMILMYETLWSSHLQLTWAFRKEDATYEIINASGDIERKSYKNTDLLGDVRVRVEKNAGYDESIYQAEAAQEALDSGLYDLSSKLAKDKILKLMRLPNDVNEGDAAQIERAEAAWTDFVHQNSIPVMDFSTQDSFLWYQVLGMRWATSDESLCMQKAVNWPDALKVIAGWERKLQIAAQQDAMQRQYYEGHDPNTWGEIYRQGEAHSSNIRAISKATANLGGQPTPPFVMPQPPQNGQFLPEEPSQRIYMLLKNMLGPAVPQGPVHPDLQSALPDEAKGAYMLDTLLQFYCVIQACRLDAQSKQPQQAIATPGGQPPPPPPGGTPGQAGLGAPAANAGPSGQ